MAKPRKSQKSQTTPKLSERQIKRKNEEDFIEELETKIQEFNDESTPISQFSDLPLSKETLQGLKKAHFLKTTDIQRRSIIKSLKGHDILGAARTGSGKTLAFLIPLLEVLYRNKWTQLDGLGALVISPTRELAIQIFNVLKSIGKFHSFSVGLLTGGKSYQDEKERIGKLNIIISTPGRLLQHISESHDFDTTNLKMLILDEADRILDMGFKQTMDNIFESLPIDRQTLLFSATQQKSINDLARLSLINPLFITSTPEDASATPKSLQQSYSIVNLQDKLNILYSFIRTHTKSKMIVFFSSSKQVRFVFETFKTLQPGISLIYLSGKLKQAARIERTSKFSRAEHACLLATDIAARGLDFPTVDWVIQVDAPEDVDTYVHRVGRTARFGRKGQSLLLLTKSEEEGMLARLQIKKIEINNLKIREDKKKSIKNELQHLCFENSEIKYLAQKAFISYYKSILTQHDKSIFNVDNIPLKEYAESLGLSGAPKIKKPTGNGNKSKELKNTSRKLLAVARGDEDGNQKKEDDQPKDKYQRLFTRKNQDVLSEHYRNLVKNDGDNESDDAEDFMTVKRIDHDLKDADSDLHELPTSNRAMKRAVSRKASLKQNGNPTKLIFDDDGVPHSLYELKGEEDFKADGTATEQQAKFIEGETEQMITADVDDKDLQKDKRLAKKRKRKEAERKLRELEENDGIDGPVAVLGGDISDEEVYNDFNQSSAAISASESQSESDHERPTKKSKKHRHNKDKGTKIIEVDEPETLADLEALSSKLLHG